ncbi:hypothetical protein PX52LOC_03502 [Limnoglobus roseus]|uniref:Uncharacterized protein n=1 Tax=Limnoglobus roseus TaxID=2598579 RepID=A0A5C1AFM6_9BACT|nr:hypothetical protein PX52LOC_03502 [Limnoglobus roseus]
MNINYAGIGLLFLAVYQATVLDFPSALQSLFAALTAFGVKVAVSRGIRQNNLLTDHLLMNARSHTRDVEAKVDAVANSIEGYHLLAIPKAEVEPLVNKESE